MAESSHGSLNLDTRSLLQIKALFPGVSAALLYDTLHDTAYTRNWDAYCVSTEDICYIDPMNIISYYASQYQQLIYHINSVIMAKFTA